jgi:hypothetical protein
MATLPTEVQSLHGIPPQINNACEFTQVLMKLQRATHLIASTLDLDALLDRCQGPRQFHWERRGWSLAP